MRHLKTAIHPDISHIDAPYIDRLAGRAIVLKDTKILMLYTARYHDYTLPGGGIDANENIEQGFIRELQEETGAQNIRNIKPYGMYEEYRPWHKDNVNILKMRSYCFTCDIDDTLGQTQLEDYEINNGMKPVWINIDDAIAHNEHTIATSNKKGLSIERETFLLKLIRSELIINDCV